MIVAQPWPTARILSALIARPWLCLSSVRARAPVQNNMCTIMTCHHLAVRMKLCARVCLHRLACARVLDDGGVPGTVGQATG